MIKLKQYSIESTTSLTTALKKMDEIRTKLLIIGSGKK